MTVAAAERASPFHLFLIGLITILGQVVLLREMLVASFGSELIYLLAIGVQMIGTAAGAMLGGRGAVSDLRLRSLFLAFAVALPLLVTFLRSERILFRGTPGAFLPFAVQLIAVVASMIPAGMSGGLLFTAAARLFIASGRTPAVAYAIESAGGLAGGLLSTLLLAFGLQNFAAAILCALIAAAASIGRRLAVTGSVVALVLGLALINASRLDRELTALNHPELLATRDTPYGRATITGALGQVVVFVNDALAFESQGTSAEEFVHVAALQTKPGDVLVLGGTIEGIHGEVAKHRPSRITQVEIDERMTAVARAHVRRDFAETTFDDPRRFLERPESYDLILSAMAEPDSGQASRFYTREFFDRCAKRLRPGGVAAFRLRSSENLWTPALARRTASIVNAVRSSFADVIVLPGAYNVVIASNSRLERDPAVLAARFRERNIEARLVSPAYLRYIYTNDRRAEVETILATTRAPVSSDSRPVAYHYTILLWLSRFFPSLALAPAMEISRPRMIASLLFLTVVALSFAARRTRVLKRILLVAFAGFAGVVLEGALILAYQTKEGVLYQDLGALLAAFMAGLAAGAWLIGRRANPATATGVMLLLATAASSSATAWAVSSPGRGLAAFVLCLGVAGFMTGALFAFGSVRTIGDPPAVIAPLYAADLLGGAAGSVVAALFLVPLAGIPASLLLVGLLAIAALPLT